ncbi:MAG: prolyl oligopeptidase family serine peptidase [Thermoanaerobaculaceae bacterium]|jgi:prolyl oligopeptidase
MAPVRDVTDDYHGTKVVDPYRYMENLQDPEVQAWFKSQNDYTRAVLANLPGRAQLLARIRELDQSVPQVGARRLPGDLYLVWKRLPTEDVGKLYLRSGLDGQDRLLVDPEKITLTAANQAKGKNDLLGLAVSDDGRYIAIGIIPGGSETNAEVHVIEIASGRETGDVIARGVGPEAWNPHWLPDNRSFVYGRTQTLPPGAAASEARQKFRSYLHVLGTDPEKDPPVFGYGVVPSIDVDPSLIASVTTEPGSRYAFGVLNGSVTPNSAYYIAAVGSIGKPNPAWRKVADFADGVTSIAVQGDDLYLLTYKDAPRYKIVRIDARKPDLASAEIVVPPGEAVIMGMTAAQDALYVRLLDGGIGRLLRVPYGPAPKVERVAIPFDGSVFATRVDPRLPGAILYMTSWTKAFKVDAYDPNTKRVTDTKLQPTGPYDDPANVESVEVQARSYDGTLVPLSIIHPKGMKLDGSNPTFLTGYGSYGYSQDPYFVQASLPWYEKGGVMATCHVRGGGEYGEEWHLAGKGRTKPNTWRDFIACAQYLIDNKYTSPARLAGEGGSAGGILIGRAITERPDLFGAALIDVGMEDALRAETTGNGETNIPEFGSTKTPEGFAALYEMSAFHHVRDRTPYPAILLTTGINDPRIDPWMPSKMTARLQAATSSGKPVLLRVDYGGGHGGGGGAEEFRARMADEWSFLLWQFGVPEFQPPKTVR